MDQIISSLAAHIHVTMLGFIKVLSGETIPMSVLS